MDCCASTINLLKKVIYFLRPEILPRFLDFCLISLFVQTREVHGQLFRRSTVITSIRSQDCLTDDNSNRSNDSQAFPVFEASDNARVPFRTERFEDSFFFSEGNASRSRISNLYRPQNVQC